MVPAPFKVVLDANVLYPFTLRDTLLRAAARGSYQVHGSEQILEEARRNLVGRYVARRNTCHTRSTSVWAVTAAHSPARR